MEFIYFPLFRNCRVENVMSDSWIKKYQRATIFVLGISLFHYQRTNMRHYAVNKDFREEMMNDVRLKRGESRSESRSADAKFHFERLLFGKIARAADVS